jgi:hypothetical protein
MVAKEASAASVSRARLVQKLSEPSKGSTLRDLLEEHTAQDIPRFRFLWTFARRCSVQLGRTRQGFARVCKEKSDIAIVGCGGLEPGCVGAENKEHTIII